MVDLNNLRSKLQYYYLNTFNNLTINDLKELKWKLKYLIFITFIQTTKILEIYLEKYYEINDNKLKQLNQLKTNNHNNENMRELKRNIEEEYKYNFINLILNICIDYNYPPAIEPFSNPLQSLYDDNNFVLNVIEFFLNVIIIPSSEMRPLQLSLNSEINNTSSSTLITQPSIITSPSISTSVPPTPDKNRNEKLISSSRKSMTPKPSRPSSRGNISEIHDNEIHQQQQQQQHQQNYNNSNQSQDTNRSLGDYQSLSKSFQILQHHNQQLTKQLKLLQDSIMARDDSERKIDLLIRDLQLSINEIADIGSSQTSDSTQNNTDQSSNLIPTSTSTQTSSSSSSIRSKESQRRNQSYNTQTNTSISWKTFQNRIQDLHSRWTEARRSAKSAIFSVITIHPLTSNVTKKYNHEEEGNRIKIKSNDDSYRIGTSRRSTPTKSLSTTHTTTPTKHRSIKSAPLSRIEENYQNPTIKLSHILGVSPALSFGEINSNIDNQFHTESSINSSVYLDISRIHILQQDLVNFSKTAFEFTHHLNSLKQPIQSNMSTQSSILNINEDIKYDNLTENSHLTNLLDNILKYEETLISLRLHSRSLLLHTSCLAPLAPISAWKPLTSSKTGLDVFIETITEILESKKLLTPSIQRMIDRSKSEQYSLLLSQHESEKLINKWKQVTNESYEIIKNLTNSISHIFQKVISEIKTIHNSLNLIHSTWLQCEKTRINIPSFNSNFIIGLHDNISTTSSTLVSPLDVLCRGYLGEDMASLINTMRLYERDLKNIIDRLTFIQKQFIHEMNENISKSFILCYQKYKELTH